MDERLIPVKWYENWWDWVEHFLAKNFAQTKLVPPTLILGKNNTKLKPPLPELSLGRPQNWQHQLMSKRSSAVLILYHVTNFNSALKPCQFPQSWKTPKVIQISKPGKTKLYPQSYRPTPLLSTISKLFERPFHSRFKPYLQYKEQFGFRWVTPWYNNWWTFWLTYVMWSYVQLQFSCTAARRVTGAGIKARTFSTT